MRIKHWQGYGTVDAKKITGDGTTLHIKVSGNHEWGLRRDDLYDLFNWLVKRFDKAETDFQDWRKRLWDYSIEEGWDANEDFVHYYFNYDRR